MDKGDKIGLSVALKPYKYANGAVNYVEVLKVPFNDRLPALIQKQGLERVHKLLGAAIQVAMESLNLKQPLSADQTFDLVDAILDSSTEDYLGIEDVVLFLQKLVRGEAGTLYNQMDIPKFMKMFEEYRQERHTACLRAREEQHVQNKISGKSDYRTSIEQGDVDTPAFFELLQTYNESRSEDNA